MFFILKTRGKYGQHILNLSLGAIDSKTYFVLLFCPIYSNGGNIVGVIKSCIRFDVINTGMYVYMVEVMLATSKYYLCLDQEVRV